MPPRRPHSISAAQDTREARSARRAQGTQDTGAFAPAPLRAAHDAVRAGGRPLASPSRRWHRITLLAALSAPAALGPAMASAQQATNPPVDVAEEIRQLRQQIADQNARIEELRRELARSTPPPPPGPSIDTNIPDAAPPAPQEPLTAHSGASGSTFSAWVHAAGPARLSATRGTGPVIGAPSELPASPLSQPVTMSAPAPTSTPAPTPGPVPAASPESAGGPQPVGAPPPREQRPPAVAPLFEQPGVLTPRGQTVLEPSLQYGYSSSNRVALVGYTIIPALLIGLIDVREVKRNTTTGALTLRRGLTNRFELEARIPYVHRSDHTVSRELFTGTATERAFDTSGRHLGDVELAARYQLNLPQPEGPFYVAGLRIKTRTGRDPFEVVTDCQTRCVGQNATGTGLPLTLPTGSGFYSLQPNLTMLFASDPAVFFGSVSYLHNVRRRDVRRLVLNGERESLGEVKPGDVIGFNFGMGLALNDKTTLSIGYDHNSVARTKQNGETVPGSVRTQLGTLLIGYSYRLSDKRTLNVAIGAGLTRDTPDVTLTVRVPFSF